MKIVIYGSGENSYQAYHILKHDKSVEVVGYLEDDASKHGRPHLGKTILGGGAELPKLRAQGVTGAIVAIGDNYARRKVTERVRAAGLTLVNAIHPQAIIDSPKHIGQGVIIEMAVCIHPESTIGDGVFLGGSAVISHHSTVGDFALIAGGVVFGGNVQVGENTLLGVGVAIQPHVKIGRDVVVGVGSAVVKDIPDAVIAVGVPAKVIRERVIEPSPSTS